MYLVDFVDLYDFLSFLMILGCLDLEFQCLYLSLRSAKGVNNCQVSPSAHMRTAKGLVLTESMLDGSIFGFSFKNQQLVP